ncbi:tRNA lysidine(34) synthetase TilS [Clostridiaceae bacterium]|nr:tRNA lysidine(34) synthetase TilS [Clostridiaceae bacterium]RKI14067.1 tRNA lysidine(34) synthetase TilS [bacterium 1XD21-70]
MREKVWEFIEDNEMLKPGDRVVVGVSGGADSVCLLLVLAENEIGLQIRAVHVHHGIRGREADRDAAYVEGFCARLGVPQKTVCRDVPGYAREHGLSVEEAGRAVRYEVMEEEAGRWQQEEDGEGQRPVWIAVAHHQDDNAETILHHLFRGSGLRGLAGMRPVQKNRIRPLLAVRRQEIQDYLESRGIGWREDSTNLSGEYTRNRIRNELIPYVSGHVNGRAVENVLRAGGIFRQADDYLQKQAGKVWQQSGKAGKGTGKGGRQVVRASMDAREFWGQEPVIRIYLIRRMLDEADAGHRDITARHLGLIGRLTAGGSLDLPGCLRAFCSSQEIGIENYGAAAGEEILPVRRDACPAEVLVPGTVPLLPGELRCAVFPRKKGAEIPKKEYTKWFDYDKIKGTLSARHRQPGDYLTLPGGGCKTLKRFLIDEKVPREHRDEIWLLAEGKHVLWVVGYRISEYYKIVEETHTILQVEFYGGKAYGRQDPGIIVRRGSEPEDQ